MIKHRVTVYVRRVIALVLDGYLRIMSHLMHVVQKRLVRLVLAGGLVTGAIGAPLLLTAGTAQAAACGTANAAGVACTLNGSMTLTGGTLTLTVPMNALSWTGAELGSDLNLVDSNTAHQSYSVNDATGSGAGWHVTASATTFTDSAATPVAYLPTSAFSTNGSTWALTSSNAPTPACAALATCLLPNNLTGYPVYLTTAAATPPASNIYDTHALTGLGSMTIGIGANPVGWWLTVPASTVAGTYTSTITMQIISAP